MCTIYRAGTIGATGVAMATHFLAPLQKKWQYRYVCTSDSLIQVNIVMVSAVLALYMILDTATKEEGVVDSLDTFPCVGW